MHPLNVFGIIAFCHSVVKTSRKAFSLSQRCTNLTRGLCIRQAFSFKSYHQAIMSAKPILDRDRPPSSGAVENCPISTLTRTDCKWVGRSTIVCRTSMAKRLRNDTCYCSRRMPIRRRPGGRSAKSVKCRDGAAGARCSENMVYSLLDP